jgi:hypothetical protein
MAKMELNAIKEDQETIANRIEGKNIEGYTNYSDVENGIRLRNRSQIEIEYASKLDRIYLNKIIESFQKDFCRLYKPKRVNFGFE